MNYIGAEAVVSVSGKRVIKTRIKKSYRIEELDSKIRKSRTRAEARIIEKAIRAIPVPKILNTDGESCVIEMDNIEGKRLSDCLDSLKDRCEIARKIGENTAKMHDADIIHGDLTTSNMILKDDRVYFIDFGLSFISHKIEDKAVDLHLLRQALEARHFSCWKELFESVNKGYEKSKNYEDVIRRFEAVEKRGRYKSQT